MMAKLPMEEETMKRVKCVLYSKARTVLDFTEAETAYRNAQTRTLIKQQGQASTQLQYVPANPSVILVPSNNLACYWDYSISLMADGGPHKN